MTDQRRAGGARRQFLKFALVGFACFVVDAGLVAVLVAVGLSPLAARVASVAAATATSFTLNRRLTFRSTNPHWRHELRRFLGANVVGIALNYGVFAAVLGLLRGQATALPTAIVAGSVTGLLANFVGARYYAFAAARRR